MAPGSDAVANERFAKTDLGRDEISHRSLRLPPLLRRLLLLVDGQRTVAELAPLVPGQDVESLLVELIERRCIRSTPRVPDISFVDMAAPPARRAPELAGLPPASGRRPQDVANARQFMVRTIRKVHGPSQRLALVMQIADCADAEALRAQYPAWEEAVRASSAGHRRLGELRRRLFAVL